jgi:hypothetical protein
VEGGAVEADYGAAGDGAAVDEGAGQVEPDRRPGQEAAGSVKVARLRADVDLRNQRGLDAAVGEKTIRARPLLR